MGNVRLCAAYTEWSRLTMRGERLPKVRVASILAPAWSNSANQRWRSRGRSGGESPGAGLCAAHQLDMAGKRQLSVSHSIIAGALVNEPAHSVVRQHPAVELLAHELSALAAQHTSALQQMRFELIEHCLDLPALVVERRQFQRRGGGRIEQGAQQPVGRSP